MIPIYIAAIAICAGSLLVGRALFVLLGRRSWSWLEPAVGLAALITAGHLAIGLPGPLPTGGVMAALAVGALVLAAVAVLLAARRDPLTRPERLGRRDAGAALAIVLIVLAVAAIPFGLNDRTGVLGEGIYSNDHAVHLYWADWLQNEVGPEPRGIGWGYPVGPHALVAAVSAVTGFTAETSFNGLMLAMLALIALTSLAALSAMAPLRRTIVASLVGLPYLLVSFYAQSSFKEMGIALFVLAFALTLAALSREGEPRTAGVRTALPDEHPDRALVVGVVLLAVASVLTFSVPGLAWFGIGFAIWVAVELAIGRLPFSPRAALHWLRRAWPALAVAAVVIGAIAVIEAGTISRFAERINEVQESQGRLARRIPPWQALGIWPSGDFRSPSAEVAGAEAAIALGLFALVVAMVWWIWRRELAVPALLVTAVIVYLASRVTSGIHVEAKALIVVAPLAMLVLLRGLLEGDARGWDALRFALGAVVAAAAIGSTLFAMRAVPVGTSGHAEELGQLREHVAGEPVAFLSLDRFGAYRLRGAEEVRSPGGYLPNPLRPRGGKEWSQGEAIDFDSLQPTVLDRFHYAVTTGAAYGSAAPGNWTPVARTTSFVLWERDGPTPRRLILREEDLGPGATMPCDGRFGSATGTAGAWTGAPIVARVDPWEPRRVIEAGETAHAELVLPAGRWQLSLQYDSEVDLRLEGGGLDVDLVASLDGMYANAPGRSSFWPVGLVETEGETVRVEVTAEQAPALGRMVGVTRHAWLGDLTAVPAEDDPAEPPGPPQEGGGVIESVPLGEACGRYVDWYILD